MVLINNQRDSKFNLFWCNVYDYKMVLVWIWKFPTCEKMKCLCFLMLFKKQKKKGRTK